MDSISRLGSGWWLQNGVNKVSETRGLLDRFSGRYGPWVSVFCDLRKTISASINKMGFSFVNSELISVSVLVEEILIECEETIGKLKRTIFKVMLKTRSLIGSHGSLLPPD